MPHRSRSQQQAIARLHHMACLDSTGPHLIAPVLRELRRIVAFDSGGYFYPSDAGAPGGYVESPGLLAVMPDYFDERVQRSEGQVLSRRLGDFSLALAKPSVLEHGQLLAVSRAVLYRSDYYEAIMRPADLQTWVALPLRASQGRVLGKLSLFRHGSAAALRPFTPGELSTLERLQACLARVLQPGEFEADDCAAQDNGLLIVTPHGRLLWTSPEAERLLSLAFGWRWRGAGGALPHELQLLLQRLQWAGQGPSDTSLPQTEWHTAGGWFSLRATRMTAAVGEGDAVALYITQRVARGTRLLETLQGWSLPPRQHALAYWMARGCSEAMIAERLGVSLPTVVHHRRALYERLGVQDRQGLFAQMLAAPGAQAEA
ncbi:helix-turn-helix domain-containing protein [Paenacidovorax monticola]|uniref:Helix-turn-helix transcriptional regulator n=1 Tax=Paenacidovorax monticola TaxID=1926868 RepID=A0A7H0HCX1_9BURK|nr:helix-turn-helix transcriptional regulator [Paenacidovorax monticola]QNP58387.1 helix-turn-helix transcriptional regulator [Paenacidovorax monticola]